MPAEKIIVEVACPRSPEVLSPQLPSRQPSEVMDMLAPPS